MAKLKTPPASLLSIQPLVPILQFAGRSPDRDQGLGKLVWLDIQDNFLQLEAYRADRCLTIRKKLPAMQAAQGRILLDGDVFLRMVEKSQEFPELTLDTIKHNLRCKAGRSTANLKDQSTVWALDTAHSFNRDIDLLQKAAIPWQHTFSLDGLAFRACLDIARLFCGDPGRDLNLVNLHIIQGLPQEGRMESTDGFSAFSGRLDFQQWPPSLLHDLNICFPVEACADLSKLILDEPLILQVSENHILLEQSGQEIYVSRYNRENHPGFEQIVFEQGIFPLIAAPVSALRARLDLCQPILRGEESCWVCLYYFKEPEAPAGLYYLDTRDRELGRTISYVPEQLIQGTPFDGRVIFNAVRMLAILKHIPADGKIEYLAKRLRITSGDNTWVMAMMDMDFMPDIKEDVHIA